MRHVCCQPLSLFGCVHFPMIVVLARDSGPKTLAARISWFVVAHTTCTQSCGQEHELPNKFAQWVRRQLITRISGTLAHPLF
jgi:hypothetical protein